MILIAPTIKNVVQIAVSLIVIAIVLPMGLGLISAMGSTMIALNSTTSAQLDTLIDPSVLTLVTVLVPILAVIGIALAYISYSRGK